MSEKFMIDGVNAAHVFEPACEAECLTIIASACLDKCALVPFGGGTKLQTGNLIQADHWSGLSSKSMDSLIEFSADDMVVTCGPGMTLAALQEVLRKANQFLPFDAAHPVTATMGGIVATNDQGFLRPAFGLPRDRLLGARIALSDGTIIRAGGKVVKNVAGYDLCKLICNSWGTLGFITEVTFKTNPIPEATSKLSVSSDNKKELIKLGLELQFGCIRPTYTVFDTAEANKLLIGLHGSQLDVDWQIAQIEALVSQRLGAIVVPDANVAELEVDGLSGRITVLPTDVSAVIFALEPYCDRMVSQFGNGVIQAKFKEPDQTPTNFDQLIRKLLPSGAHLVWTSVPSKWKLSLDIWGKPGAGIEAMRGIKAAFDIANVFSPGRFVGGI